MRNFIGATLLLLPATLHAEPLTFDAALQRAQSEAPSLKSREARRHLKVCSPDNDFSDISGTWATLHASTAPLAR